MIGSEKSVRGIVCDTHLGTYEIVPRLPIDWA